MHSLAITVSLSYDYFTHNDNSSELDVYRICFSYADRYGFAAFKTEEDCKAAHDSMQGKVIDGKILMVLFAKKCSRRDVPAVLQPAKPKASAAAPAKTEKAAGKSYFCVVLCLTIYKPLLSAAQKCRQPKEKGNI